MTKLFAILAPLGFVAGLALGLIGALELLDRAIGWWLPQ